MDAISDRISVFQKQTWFDSFTKWAIVRILRAILMPIVLERLRKRTSSILCENKTGGAFYEQCLRRAAGNFNEARAPRSGGCKFYYPKGFESG